MQLSTLVVLAALAGCGAATPLPPENTATFVGSPACADCHADAYAAWQPSQHARAMQPATDSTVLGDFNDATLRVAGVTTTFFRRAGRFLVRTEGPDGQPAEFEVTHTFGLEPLQQYLIPLTKGRLQAFSIAWDSRSKRDGGQRWFHLVPDQPPAAGDPFHWTGYQQTWNYQCADCHSTNLRKGWDDSTATYHTTWSEISVGCEACHGPGSNHVAWAESTSADSGDARRYQAMGLAARLDERKSISWTTNATSGKPVRSAARTTEREINTCARCHARRGQLTDAVHAGDPLLDGFRPAVVEPGLYHPDGQMREEVYTWGSFLQSRMYAAGVTCSDCHEPHSGKLRAPGSQVCAQCHTPDRYAATGHTLHQPGTPGADCVSCHMPTVTYMVVDPRHDHAFRVPRPDLSDLTGAPNTCTTCHTDRSSTWAADQIEDHLGRRPIGFQNFGEAFAVAERGGSITDLAAIARDGRQAGIVRASALLRLSAAPGWNPGPELTAALADPDPVVRAAGTRVAGSVLQVQQRPGALAPLLSDPLRLIRMDAGLGLAEVPEGQLPVEWREGQAKGLAEYLAAQEFIRDRPEGWGNIGNLRAIQGQVTPAIEALQMALERDSSWAPAWINLSDVYRTSGQEGAAKTVLATARQRLPRDAAIAHALGLTLVRLGERPAALAALGEAVRLDRSTPRYAFVHAVALHDLGQPAEALAALRAARRLHPGDRDLAETLMNYLMEGGDVQEARLVLQGMVEADPLNPVWQQWIGRLGGRSLTP